MANIKEEHKHIPFKYGTITWTGAGYPSEEMMQVFNLMADLAVQKCEGKADSTSEKDLRVCEVSNRASNLGQEALSEFLTQGMNSWGARYEVQYSDYSENQWTAPVLITEDRITRIINDNSVKKVRMSFRP